MRSRGFPTESKGSGKRHRTHVAPILIKLRRFEIRPLARWTIRSYSIGGFTYNGFSKIFLPHNVKIIVLSDEVSFIDFEGMGFNPYTFDLGMFLDYIAAGKQLCYMQ
jgi:thiamine kinase-like enzyme